MKYLLFSTIIFLGACAKEEPVCDLESLYGQYECRHYYSGNMADSNGWLTYVTDTLLGIDTIEVLPVPGCEAIIFYGIQVSRISATSFGLDNSNNYDKSESWAVQFYEPDSIAASYSLITGYPTIYGQFEKYRGRKISK